MSEKDKIDALLRVISNRCRNLRKAIDRGKAWQQVADAGTELNEQQLASVQAVPRKEALLAELNEILKKQTQLAQSCDPDPSPEPTSSKRAAAKTARAAKSSNRAKGNPPHKSAPANKPKHSVVTGSTTPDGIAASPSVSTPDAVSVPATTPAVEAIPDVAASPATVSEAEPVSRVVSDTEGIVDPTCVKVRDVPMQDKTTGNNSNGPKPVSAGVNESHISDVSSSSAHSTSTNQPSAASDPYSDKVATIVHEMERRHLHHLQQTKADCIRQVLNLFHVVDFLHQRGSREALLAFFNETDSHPKTKSLTSLEMDLLCYFNVMLSSPNGNVPHNDAVDVSLEHCLEFLQCSTSEAFKGTTYATLVDIVHRIASCPIITDRGSSSGSKKDMARSLRGGDDGHGGASVKAAPIVEHVTSSSLL